MTAFEELLAAYIKIFGLEYPDTLTARTLPDYAGKQAMPMSGRRQLLRFGTSPDAQPSQA